MKTLEIISVLSVKAVDSILYKQVLLILGEIYLHDLKFYPKALLTYTKLRDLASYHS